MRRCFHRTGTEDRSRAHRTERQAARSREDQAHHHHRHAGCGDKEAGGEVDDQIKIEIGLHQEGTRLRLLNFGFFYRKDLWHALQAHTPPLIPVKAPSFVVYSRRRRRRLSPTSSNWLKANANGPIPLRERNPKTGSTTAPFFIASSQI